MTENEVLKLVAEFKSLLNHARGVEREECRERIRNAIGRRESDARLWVCYGDWFDLRPVNRETAEAALNAYRKALDLDFSSLDDHEQRHFISVLVQRRRLEGLWGGVLMLSLLGALAAWARDRWPASTFGQAFGWVVLLLMVIGIVAGSREYLAGYCRTRRHLRTGGQVASSSQS